MLRKMCRGWLAAVVLVAALPWVAPALADAPELEAAQQLYDQGKYTEALERLRDALEGGKVTGGDAIRARELIARCQVKSGDLDGAQKTFLAMLRRDPQYAPDAARVPPDEMEAFSAARRAFEEEQERGRHRIPACIGLFYGVGSGANRDFGEFVASGGGGKSYDHDPEFGGFVRFPLRPRLSFQLEMQRFRSTNADSGTGTRARSYEITAIPLTAGLHWLVVQRPRWRAAVFAGGGPMMQSKSALEFGLGAFRISASDTKVGTYLHGGLEGELLLFRRFSLDARVLGRYAKATGLSIFETDDFDYPAGVPIVNRDVDFSGFGAHVGLRAYIGD